MSGHKAWEAGRSHKRTGSGARGHGGAGARASRGGCRGFSLRPDMFPFLKPAVRRRWNNVRNRGYAPSGVPDQAHNGTATGTARPRPKNGEPTLREFLDGNKAKVAKLEAGWWPKFDRAADQDLMESQYCSVCTERYQSLARGHHDAKARAWATREPTRVGTFCTCPGGHVNEHSKNLPGN